MLALDGSCGDGKVHFRILHCWLMDIRKPGLGRHQLVADEL